MSTTTPSFSKQQELANKRPKDLEDHEKIFLLKREIDNLRSQIKDTGVVQEGLPASSNNAVQVSNQGFCSSGFCRAPMLTIFLALGVAMLARWRRRQSVFHRRAQAPEMTMQFELRDAHESYVYQAPPGGAVQEFV
mmetsp:Transcript_132203/g.196975  ORF Transcript_132203/g.196975 Transcript_132203/m.196975 type:complete len:136 (-) Transcript_132203:169-576(-)|eukprot:CAMPEP_0116999900 /NCGR_PEP_ID=MMETSP0472-20121206/2439_1 /TAXON_ID=693140 ORGANISM="Tiarina fusus, Strain LIS" /NCGR_SAMPLE_ID=MMETSP0472 /ASSEMBLY_ACC=CAM_ASM_000603 /LENGTH=135 /DNA_ID=CAMNT_0004699449 /DNA_START=140 /DNA_END=547 /DNA_ORIENTATION=-